MFNGALPAGGLDAAHLPLVLARAVWLAGLLSATGALLFRALEASGEAGRLPAVREGLSRLIVASLLLAGAAWLCWTVLQAAAIAGATTPAATLAALVPVFSRTLFGHLAAAQAALLLLAWAARRWHWLPALCALAATTLQVGHLHAWAMDGAASLLTGAVLLHLWAAAGWLGALLPLRLVVRVAPPAAARPVVRRFSARATICVAVLALTALWQGYRLLGGIAGLFGTTYGWVAMSKAALFAVLLAMAWRHRFRLAPALGEGSARAALARGIAVETGLGAAVVLAAAVLSALPPGMHTPPVWPFTLRPRLPLGGADMAALAALAAAVLLPATAVLLRRHRLPALAGAGVLGWLALPHVGGMMEPATPTGYFRSPTGFTAASVADGGAVFARRCGACHAGPALAPGLTDGDLFWIVTAGRRDMPGFAAELDEDARWHVVDFLRARADAGSLPVRAPDLDIACADGAAQSLGDLRGRMVRLLFQPNQGGPDQDGAPPPAAAGVPVVTLRAPRPPVPARAAQGCVVTDPDARVAFAAATGLAPDALAGAELLIDQGGWLREVVRPGADAAARAAALARAAGPPTRRPAG